MSYPLYGGTPPHEQTPTSREAAESVRASSATQRDRLLVMFASDLDWTDDELERATGWRHQSLSARRRELVLLGLVQDTGKRRRTRSGRAATVWSIV